MSSKLEKALHYAASCHELHDIHNLPQAGCPYCDNKVLKQQLSAANENAAHWEHHFELLENAVAELVPAITDNPDEWDTEGWEYDVLREAKTRLQQLSALRAEREWVPVSERLPEENGVYYALTKDFPNRPIQHLFSDGAWGLLGADVRYWFDLRLPPLPTPPTKEDGQ